MMLRSLRERGSSRLAGKAEMPGLRRPGPDHPHFAYSPIVERTPWRLPNGARLAIVPVISLAYYEDYPPPGAQQPAWLAGGVGPRNAPNIARLSAWEYGHRVGIFRLLDALEGAGFPPTVAVDALTADRYPWLVEHLCARGAEILAHGVGVTRMPSAALSEEDERDQIGWALASLRACGVSPRGWLGPEYGESPRTPTLVAEAGFEFICDWCCDEQPFPFANGLTGFPLMADLDDAFALALRGVSVLAYGRMLRRAFDQLAADGTRSARVLAFLVRPFVIGQPSRIGRVGLAAIRLEDDPKRGRRVVSRASLGEPGAGRVAL
jgi:allantoinase